MTRTREKGRGKIKRSQFFKRQQLEYSMFAGTTAASHFCARKMTPWPSSIDRTAWSIRCNHDVRPAGEHLGQPEQSASAFSRGRTAHSDVTKPFHKSRENVAVSAGADQSARRARGEKTAENRWQQEEPVMPDRENERVLDAGPHHAAPVFQFETQSVDPELNEAIS